MQQKLSVGNASRDPHPSPTEPVDAKIRRAEQKLLRSRRKIVRAKMPGNALNKITEFKEYLRTILQDSFHLHRNGADHLLQKLNEKNMCCGSRCLHACFEQGGVNIRRIGHCTSILTPHDGFCNRPKLMKRRRRFGHVCNIQLSKLLQRLSAPRKTQKNEFLIEDNSTKTYPNLKHRCIPQFWKDYRTITR